MMPNGTVVWGTIPNEGCRMIKLYLSYFHQIGVHLGRLTGLSPSATRLDIAIASWPVENHVRGLLSNPNFPLRVSHLPGEEFLKATATMRAKMQKEASSSASPPDWNQPVTYQDAEFHTVVNTAKNFEIVLQAEMDALATYYVEGKGAYVTEKLIFTAEETLPLSLLQYLDAKAKEDMRSSGRCLALDVPTASGFHILRAAESVLYRYYVKVCKPKDEKTLGNWGAYLGALYEASGGKDKVTDQEAREVYHILTRIKNHRNNIMHPEWVLTADQAFTLFENAKSAIMVMLPRLSTVEADAGQEEVKTEI